MIEIFAYKHLTGSLKNKKIIGTTVVNYYLKKLQVTTKKKLYLL